MDCGRSGGALLLGTHVCIEFLRPCVLHVSSWLSAPHKRSIHRILCSCEHVSGKSAVVCEATSFRLVEVHRRFGKHRTASFRAKGTLHKQWASVPFPLLPWLTHHWTFNGKVPPKRRWSIVALVAVPFNCSSWRRIRFRARRGQAQTFPTRAPLDWVTSHSSLFNDALSSSGCVVSNGVGLEWCNEWYLNAPMQATCPPISEITYTWGHVSVSARCDGSLQQHGSTSGSKSLTVNKQIDCTNLCRGVQDAPAMAYRRYKQKDIVIVEKLIPRY
jgi:hypothetical protein